MNGAERNQRERETEVVAKPSRRRVTIEYKRKIVRLRSNFFPYCCETLGKRGRADEGP